MKKLLKYLTPISIGCIGVGVITPISIIAHKTEQYDYSYNERETYQVEQIFKQGYVLVDVHYDIEDGKTHVIYKDQNNYHYEITLYGLTPEDVFAIRDKIKA